MPSHHDETTLMLTFPTFPSLPIDKNTRRQMVAIFSRPAIARAALTDLSCPACQPASAAGLKHRQHTASVLLFLTAHRSPARLLSDPCKVAQQAKSLQQQEGRLEACAHTPEQQQRSRAGHVNSTLTTHPQPTTPTCSVPRSPCMRMSSVAACPERAPYTHPGPTQTAPHSHAPRMGCTAQTCRSRTTWRKDTERISPAVSLSTP